MLITAFHYLFVCIFSFWEFPVAAPTDLFNEPEVLAAPDTALASRYFNQAQQFFRQARYDSCLYYFGRSGQRFKKARVWTRLFDCVCRISHILGLKGESTKPLNDLQEAEAIGLQEYGARHPSLAQIYHHKGMIHQFKGEYDHALQFYTKSLSIRLETLGENHSAAGKLYHDIGEIHLIKAKFDQAEAYYQKALKISASNFGQDHFTAALTYGAMGNLARLKGKYQQGLEFCNKALAIFSVKMDEFLLEIASCHDNIGNLQIKMSDYVAANKSFEKALAIKRSIFDEASPLIARSLGNMAAADGERGNYKQAIEKCFKAQAIYKKFYGEHHPYHAILYNTLAIAFHSNSDLSSALAYYDKALQLNRRTFGENHYAVAANYNNLGLIHYHLGDADKALEFYDKALSIKIGMAGKDSPELMVFYNNMGNIHAYNGDYEPALEFYYKALALAHKSSLEKSRAYALLNIGMIHIYKGHYDAAFKCYEEALSKYVKLCGPNDLSTALAYNQIGNAYRIKIGNAYRNKAEYAKAIEYLDKSSAIFRKQWGENHHRLAQNYEHIGITYFAAGNWDKALEYYQKSLRMVFKIRWVGPHHIASLYKQIGEVYLKQKQIAKALAYFQKSCIGYVADFKDKNIYRNPELKNVVKMTGLLGVLELKAGAFQELFRETKKNEDIELAVSTYKLVADLIDTMRTGFRAEESKLLLGEIASRVYSKGIAAAYRAHEIFRDEQYKELAFKFAEKNKAMVLLESYRKLKTKKFAGIPDSLLERERRAKLFLAFYYKKLTAELDKGDQADKAKIELWQNKLTALQEEFGRLKQKLENAYPAYHRLHYGVHTVSLQTVRDKLIDNDRAIVEYAVGDSAVYIFTITKNALDMARVAKDANFDGQIALVREGISKQNYAQYSKYAYSLYHLLIAPIKQTIQNKKLVIIPDGALGYLPFEALLAQKPDDDEDDYRRLSFLIKDYQINYAYSATLLYENLTDRRSQKRADYLGFAPVKFSHVKPETKMNPGLLSWRTCW